MPYEGHRALKKKFAVSNFAPARTFSIQTLFSFHAIILNTLSNKIKLNFGFNEKIIHCASA